MEEKPAVGCRVAPGGESSIPRRAAGLRENGAVLLVLSVLGTSPVVWAAPEPEANTDTGIQVFETPESSPEMAAAAQRLAQQIKARLEADPWVHSWQVEVTPRQGVVTLEGTVGTLLAKERAAQVAAIIPEVQQVSNQILVVLPPRYDWAIQGEVQAYFARNPVLTNYQQLVQVEDGVVMLSGAVDSAYQKQLAGAVAANVEGVRGVENKLHVDWLAPHSDEEIRWSVESRIQWDPWLVNPLVRVQVRSGTVQLAGMVETADARRHAVEDARMEGVKSVDASALVIHPAGPTETSGPPAKW
jgi:osmotically-inducible protein OsmY